jgi:hypothetical protein
VDSTSILLRYTLLGDANGDRAVNLTDLTILAASFNQSGRSFGRGNFSYDVAGIVDLTDCTMLASNFNRSAAAAPSAIRRHSRRRADHSSYAKRFDCC